MLGASGFASSDAVAASAVPSFLAAEWQPLASSHVTLADYSAFRRHMDALGLSRAHSAVLHLLLECASRTTRLVCRSYLSLAEEVGCCRSTAISAVSLAASLGLLTVRRRFRRTNVFTVVFDSSRWLDLGKARAAGLVRSPSSRAFPRGRGLVSRMAAKVSSWLPSRSPAPAAAFSARSVIGGLAASLAAPFLPPVKAKPSPIPPVLTEGCNFSLPSKTVSFPVSRSAVDQVQIDASNARLDAILARVKRSPS